MPAWERFLGIASLLLVLVVLYGLALVVRRRWISRRGGTFELAHRAPARRLGRGWMLGMGRYREDSLEWFRVFSLSLRPRACWERDGLDFCRCREPEGTERRWLYPDHLVIDCRVRDDDVELAMSPESLTGFQSWLEARRPGTDWSR